MLLAISILGTVALGEIHKEAKLPFLEYCRYF
jgi:hypothetical protein